MTSRDKTYGVSKQNNLKVLLNQFIKQFGDDSKEVTPVPIPNTVVKLLHADDTWWVTARESK